MNEPVTSRQNSLFKRWRAIAAGEDEALVVVEGAHLLIEAAKASARIVEVALDPEAAQAREWLASPGAAGVTVTRMSRSLLASLSSLESNPGVVGIVERPSPRGRSAAGARFVLVLDGVQDPGNVGTLLRTAEATGVAEVWLLDGCADPFGAKALRASAGSAFRAAVVSRLRPEAAVESARRLGLRFVALHTDAETPSLFETPLDLPLALALGAEGRGVGPVLREAADVTVRIPQRLPVESLNVAAAGAVALYDIARRAKLV